MLCTNKTCLSKMPFDSTLNKVLKWGLAFGHSPEAISFFVLGVAFGALGLVAFRVRTQGVGPKRIASVLAGIFFGVLAVACIVGACQNIKVQAFMDLVRSKRDSS